MYCLRQSTDKVCMQWGSCLPHTASTYMYILHRTYYNMQNQYINRYKGNSLLVMVHKCTRYSLYHSLICNIENKFFSMPGSFVSIQILMHGSLQPCICLMSALHADKCWCATPQSTFRNNTTALFYSQRVFPYFPADSTCTVYLIFQNDLISLQEEGSMACSFWLRNITKMP